MSRFYQLIRSQCTLSLPRESIMFFKGKYLRTWIFKITLISNFYLLFFDLFIPLPSLYLFTCLFVHFLVWFYDVFLTFLLHKSMDWFLYVNGLRHERVKTMTQCVKSFCVRSYSSPYSVRLFPIFLQVLCKRGLFIHSKIFIDNITFISFC